MVVRVVGLGEVCVRGVWCELLKRVTCAIIGDAFQLETMVVAFVGVGCEWWDRVL